MYTQNGVPWYKLFDDYVESVTISLSALRNILSVTHLDKQNSASFAGAESQLDNLIDPKAPSNCSLHPSVTSPQCVFWPCGHLACTNCVGSAVLAGYKCPNCQATVEKFVGMQTPLPAPRKKGGAYYQEGQWSAEETEELAMAAASSKAIIVIHQQEDRPSPLYSSWGQGGSPLYSPWAIEQDGDQASPTHHTRGGIVRESDLEDFDLSTVEQSGEQQSMMKGKKTPGYWFRLRVKMNSLLRKIRSL